MGKKIYSKVVKPILFKFDPEAIHNLFTTTGRFMGGSSVIRKVLHKTLRYDSKFLEQEVAGISFKNPVGLAAGFDYNGNLTQVLESVGFGYESVGTVTYSYYEGNKKPRLVRLLKSQSILVNKGFKSDGIKTVLNRNMPKWSKTFNVGVSIGATNSKECSTPLAQIDDIVRSFEYISKHEILKRLSYLELNISCPNVLGSGSLATPEYLEMVLGKIRKIGINKPLFVKFQLEIEWEKAKELIQIMIDHKVDAVILSNLLKNREAESIDNDDKELVKELKGNFSGKPTYELSNQLIENVYREFRDKIKIIGLGGIFSAQDAYEKIKRGASLVQLITGMIYEGPQLIGEINRGLEELARKDGFNKIQEAVGSGIK